MTSASLPRNVSSVSNRNDANPMIVRRSKSIVAFSFPLDFPFAFILDFASRMEDGNAPGIGTESVIGEF